MNVKKTMQIGLGASSILMIFVVLCMMILSVLSYQQGLQKEKLANRQKTYQEKYTKADAVMQMLIHELQNDRDDKAIEQLCSTYQVTYKEHGNEIILQQTLNDHQQLYVKLIMNDHELEIKQYEVQEKESVKDHGSSSDFT